MRRLPIIDKWVQRRVEAVMAAEFSAPIGQTQPQDIFIAGFPKSGNTWMQYLAAGLQFGMAGTYLTDRLANELVPDVHARTHYRRYGAFNFFKTHHLPQPHYKRVIYLVRDGRDALVSYYAMQKNQGNAATLDEMIRQAREVFPGPWWEHVRAWAENPHGAEIISLRYEDLIAQPLAELRRVCAFAGLERNDALLQAIIDSNSFEGVKKRARQAVEMGHQEWATPVNQNFFRKGKVGSYKDEMPPELVEWFSRTAAAELQRYGYA